MPGIIKGEGEQKVRRVMREDYSRLGRTLVLNSGFSLESLGDLSVNINAPTIKTNEITF